MSCSLPPDTIGKSCRDTNATRLDAALQHLMFMAQPFIDYIRTQLNSWNEQDIRHPHWLSKAASVHLMSLLYALYLLYHASEPW